MHMHVNATIAGMEQQVADLEISSLWARFMRVSQAVLSAVEADLKVAGFPPLAWYDALLDLRRVAPDGLRQFELQQHMLRAQFNRARLVDRLTRQAQTPTTPLPVTQPKKTGRGAAATKTALSKAA